MEMLNPRMRRPMLLAVLLLLLVAGGALPARTQSQALAVLVRGGDSAATAQAVQQVGGTVTNVLAHVGIVAADLAPNQIARLQSQGLMITPDHQVVGARRHGPQGPMDDDEEEDDEEDGGTSNAFYPSQSVGADLAHTQGIQGNGVTVAIIDSGMPPLSRTSAWSRVSPTTLKYQSNTGRFIVYHDLLATGTINNSADPYGHGTHVLATIADQRTITNNSNARTGVAPKANIVMVRGLDASGQSTYSTIVEGIDWVIANKDTYGINVLNLSLQATVNGPYWYDMLNQAVMAAWDAGITVVVAAGNYGPDAATITAPGNVPYVITVGAIKSGRYTENGIDQLATYSSAGPTESKFVKPDVVVPGSRVLAPLPNNSTLAASAGLYESQGFLLYDNGLSSATGIGYYYLSGTSMSAAIMSGIVALTLQDDPTLTNDQLKYRLMSTANVAMLDANTPAYSMWQQGAGQVSLAAALASTSSESANAGMDLALDRDHENGTHYMGETTYDEATNTFAHPVPQSYEAWAGTYAIWAGTYNASANGYAAWASNYAIWAGNYAIWAGTYDAWASNYAIWAGTSPIWAGNYAIWAGTSPIWAGDIVMTEQDESDDGGTEDD